MAHLLATLVDHAVNRITGVYHGMTPRRPRELVIPRFVLIEERLPSLAEALAEHLDLDRVRRPLVLCDETTWDIAGQRVHEELEDCGCDPRRALVSGNAYDQVAGILRDMTRPPRLWSGGEAPWEQRVYGPKIPSLVFGVGGGSVVDLAKLVAFQLHVPCVTVPTSLANDGVASPFAVIRPPGEAGSATVPTHTPMGVVIDLGRILPRTADDDAFFRRMMASGVGDAVSNLTATADWELAAAEGRDRLDYLALLHARSAAEVVLERVARASTSRDHDLVLTLASALVSSGEAMTRVGSSRPASGFEHKLYHAHHNLLRIPSDAPHGVLVAVGSLVSAAAHGRWLGELQEGFGRVGLPVRVADLAAWGLEPGGIEQAIRAAGQVKPDRYTVLEHLGADAMVAAFRRAFPS